MIREDQEYARAERREERLFKFKAQFQAAFRCEHYRYLGYSDVLGLPVVRETIEENDFSIELKGPRWEAIKDVLIAQMQEFLAQVTADIIALCTDADDRMRIARGACLQNAANETNDLSPVHFGQSDTPESRSLISQRLASLKDNDVLYAPGRLSGVGIALRSFRQPMLSAIAAHATQAVDA